MIDGARKKLRMIVPGQGEAGFTIIEVLVAGLVLAVGVIGTARLLVGNESSSVDTELQQIATEEAEQQIESIRALTYDSIGHSAYPALSELPEGATVNSGSFTGPGTEGVSEELVSPENGADGSGGTVPYSSTFAVTRGNGAGDLTGTVYTFVSWRDEECSLLDLSSLTGITDLLNATSGLQAALDQLRGATGSIQLVLGQLTSTLISILPGGDDALLKAELQNLAPLLTNADGLLDTASDLVNQLNTLDIDLCDLQEVDLQGLVDALGTSVDNITALTNQLEVVDGLLDAARGPLQSLTGSLSGLVCTLLPPLCNNANTAISAALDALDGTNGTPPDTATGEVNTLLSEIAAIDISGLTADTTHNTKRVSVAVVINTPGNASPISPVWLSSVVTDPDAAILISELVP